MASFSFPVEAGHILTFARAIGDPNPVYGDADAAKGTEVGGIIAPPTFAIAAAQYDPDYPLRPKPGVPWFGSGKEPIGAKKEGGGEGGGGAARLLHAEQHFELHRPVHPGDVLTVESRPGKSWQKEGRRGGTLSFSETITEYRDPKGELVVTARSIGVRTGKAVEA